MSIIVFFILLFISNINVTLKAQVLKNETSNAKISKNDLTKFDLSKSDLDSKEDIIVLENGETYSGTFLEGDNIKIVFRINNQKKIYRQEDVKGVVSGVLKIPASQGLIPGIPQYRRAQYAKAVVISGTTILSLAIAAYGATSWLEIQSQLLRPNKLDRYKINQLQNSQINASKIFATGAVIFGVLYLFHILDWKYWGNNYNAMLTNNLNNYSKQNSGVLNFYFDIKNQNISNLVSNNTFDSVYNTGVNLNF